MKNVEKWFGYEDSIKRDCRIKYHIAIIAERYLNGCYDANYPAMTKEEWKSYIWKILSRDFDNLDLRFYGKEQTMILIDDFLNNYSDVKEYIK